MKRHIHLCTEPGHNRDVSTWLHKECPMYTVLQESYSRRSWNVGTVNIPTCGNNGQTYVGAPEVGEGGN